MVDTSSRVRFGITLQGVDPPKVFAEAVKELESSGFTYLWLTDSSLHARSVYAYLTLAALSSRTLQLGTGITHPYTRHPAITVNAISTLDEISEGRAILGVGAGDRPTVELGFSPARVQVLREMITFARRLMTGEAFNHSSSTFQLIKGKLHYRYRDRIPIYMACSGPRMLSLAGEVADGVLVQCGLFPEAVDFARQRIQEGAARAGRSIDEIDFWVMACGTIAEDGDNARNSARPMAAWFAQTAPHCCKIAGLDPGLIRDIRAAYSGGEFHLAKDAAALIPDAMVDLFTLSGTPDDARGRIEGLTNHGVQAFNFMPIGPERNISFRLFAQHIVQPLAKQI